MQCPTCNTEVAVVADDEGTGIYRPLEGRAGKGKPACKMCGAPAKAKEDR